MSRRQAAFGITPAGALVGQRLELVEEAWSRLCTSAGPSKVKENGNLIPFATLLTHYDANRHPLHVRGWTSRGRLQDLFVASFKQVARPVVAARQEASSAVEDYISHDSFIDFYVKLSQEVQVMRQKGEAALDPDAFFCNMVIGTWHLDEDWGRGESAHTDDDDELHNSNPDDVLRPTGIKAREPISKTATDMMDLVWVAPAASNSGNGSNSNKKQLVGFRGIVKPLFPRSIVAPHLRGHFVLAAEAAELPRGGGIKFLPTRPTNQPPLDFVWESPADSGKLVGLQGVVASSVDTVEMPDSILKHLMTPQQSRDAGVEFLPIEKPTGSVLFKRLNDDYGLDAVSEARRMAGLKKAAYEGTACGQVYATTFSGKFSDQFPAGPWRQAGLNTSSSKPRVYFK